MVILQRKIAGLTPESLSRFVLRARRAAGLQGTANILVTTNAAMRSLNLRFRKKDKTTDVLSFPVESGQGGRFAGEVAISAEIAAENAARLGHAVAVEVKILALHGILHLAGFDHERDNGEMARKEATSRRALRLPSSLIGRSEGEPVTPRRGATSLRRSQWTA